MGLKASAVGNHEFDEGYKELLRIQFGGCHPTDGCQFRDTYSRREVSRSSARTSPSTTGAPAAAPVHPPLRGGVPIGIIGITLQDLPDVVVASGDQGPEVRRRGRRPSTGPPTCCDRLGVKAQIVHHAPGRRDRGRCGPNACKVDAGRGPTTIAKNASPKVDAFFAGHSHQQYNCMVTDPAGQAAAAHPGPLLRAAAVGGRLSRSAARPDDVIRSTDRGPQRDRHPRRDPGPDGAGHRRPRR